MKAIAVLAAVAVITGCQTPQDLQARAGNASNFQICRAIFLAPGDVARIAQGEAQRRSLDCAPYASAVFQNEAQADAARNALARQLLTPAPMPNFPRQAQCRTIYSGAVANTVCD